MQPLFARFSDLRRGELRFVLPAFATLFLTVAAHTMLETARDALFLARFPTRDLNLVYVALAGITLVTAFASARFTAAVGRRRALVTALIGVAAGTASFFFMVPTRRVALALYLWSGVEGAMLVPQFWLLADDLFTIAQARRLFGSITSGGVLGGVAGAACAAFVVRALPVTSILPVAALLFVAAAAVTAAAKPENPDEERASIVLEMPPPKEGESGRVLFRETPFLFRIAALVGLSTAAVLVVDYLFKSVAARVVPAESLGFFFARYYAVMNAVSLVFQVLLTARVVRKLGVIGASAVTPFLLFGAAASVIVSGGFVAVLVLKTFDGGLRYSLHRVATELLYLPVPAASRQKAKTVIDSALSRTVQAVTAIGLYVAALRSLAGPRFLALGIVALCAIWLAIAVTLRHSYLDLFRGALATGGIDPNLEVEDIDMTSAEALVESMASPDSATVIAAMEVLAEHKRTALIPALILYHDDAEVLLRALDLFGRSERRDWFALAERLLDSSDDRVSAAAVHTLAKAGRLEAIEKAATHPSPRVQAYVAFFRAQREPGKPEDHPLVSCVMTAEGENGRALRLALLAAIADAPDPRAIDLLLMLASRPEFDDDEDAVEALAASIASLKSDRFIPLCLERLTKRTGREAIRDALVAIGDRALDALEALMQNAEGERHVRLHAPRSISRFGSQRAADILLAQLLRETHGSVRYKVLRALGQLVARHDVRVDRKTIEGEVLKNLVEYMRLLSFHVALEEGIGEESSEGGEANQVLLGLLEDKLSQSMERAFRLLQIVHKREDIESVHDAARSVEKVGRANAGEFLDVLLVGRDEQPLRRLLRIVVDDASDRARVERARAEVVGLVTTSAEALTLLLEDKDYVLVALAARVALVQNDPLLRRAVVSLYSRSPALEGVSERLFGRLLVPGEAHG